MTLHRADDDIAGDDDTVDVRLAHLFEHGLQRREIAVNVVEGRDAHDGPS